MADSKTEPGFEPAPLRQIRDATGALRRLLRVLARPARKGRKQQCGMIIYPYRGFGSDKDVFLMGRVFRQRKQNGWKSRHKGLRRDLADIGVRLLRRGVADAFVNASLNGTGQRVKTDPDGYFRVQMQLDEPLCSSKLWQHMALELEDKACGRSTGEVMVLPKTARFVVISDIDDTLVVTGVASKLNMLARLFLDNAQSRTAFPGAAALYRALYRGLSGSEQNPMLYVSRAPWGIYEILEEFFRHHRIPEGPILFLREWGVSLFRPFPRRARGHKKAMIRKMLSLCSTIPFVLIGDSGQHDPEVYAEIVREHPGRVLAVYIRNIDTSDGRSQAIETLARHVAQQGSTFMLAADSFAMARHMAGSGLISRQGLAAVLDEQLALQAGSEKARAFPANPGNHQF